MFTFFILITNIGLALKKLVRHLYHNHLAHLKFKFSVTFVQNSVGLPLPKLILTCGTFVKYSVPIPVTSIITIWWWIYSQT